MINTKIKALFVSSLVLISAVQVAQYYLQLNDIIFGITMGLAIGLAIMAIQKQIHFNKQINTH